MAKKLREIVVAVTADTAAYQREMNRVSRMGGGYFKTIEQGAKRADAAYQRNAAAIRLQVSAVDDATQAVANYARAAAAVFSTAKLVQYADSWTNLNNRLRLVTDGTQEFQAAQAAVLNIAKDARSPLRSTAELYQRIATNQDALGLSGQGVASVVGTISKTLAISGASAASADAALIQLGQAFASGTLRGEELNSVMEQAPALANAIAAGLGVTIGELRALGAAGELSAQKVIGALQKMAGSVDTQFSKMQATVGQSFTVLENSVIAWIGRADEASGASKALAEGIIALSNNLDGVAFVAGAAAVGAFSGKLLDVARSTMSATAQWRDARAELVGQARAVATVTAAQAEHARMQLEVARASVAASSGMQRLSIVQRELIPAQRAFEAATNAAALAQTRLNSVASLSAAAGRSLLAALGGPAGLAITVASVAAGWLLFRDNTDDAARAISNMKGPLDEVIGKYRELNAQQRDQARREVQSKLGGAQGDMQTQLARLSGVAVSAATQSSLGALETFRAAVAAINADTSLTAQEASRQIQVQIEAYVRATPVGAAYRDTLVDIAAGYSQSRTDAERYTGQLKAMNGAQQDAAGSATALGTGLSAISAGMGTADWTKYLKNLESARDLIGMSAEQAEEYKARAQGASDAQAALAGTLAQQADTAETLKKATADKDEKAIKGAKDTLEQLVKVEAQQRAIIAAAGEASRLQAQLAKGGITPEGFNQMVGAVYTKVYDQALADGTSRNAGQVEGIGSNTKPSRSAQKSGDDWSKWMKERQAEIAAQLQLADAYTKGGDAVARATLAKEVEDQVLKVGASHRGEVVRLLGLEADARAKADASKQIADMGKEIALIDAKTEAERMLWETQNGAYSALNANIRKALVARAEELDLVRKVSSRKNYIGEVSGRADADVTLEKMGWLSDAFQKGEINVKQYNKALDALTGKGKDDLSEFAIQGARNIQSYLGDALYQASTGKFEGIGQAFSDMLARMSSEAAAAQLAKALFGDFGKSNEIGGIFGTVFSAIGKSFGGSSIGGTDSTTPGSYELFMGKSAKGNVFDAGNMTPFKHGGAFTNGIVSAPVAFPMGLMGEAGEEAIIPLQRSSDGSLGVRAQLPKQLDQKDIAPRTPNVNVVNNVGEYAMAEARMSDGELLVEIDRRIASQTPRILDSQLSNPSSRGSRSMSKNFKAERRR